MVYISIFLTLIALISGTFSYAANSALPGDALYPYKISVNERVEELLAHTDATRAQLDLALLRESLDQAQTLAVHGRLDARAQTDVTNTITLRVSGVTTVLDSLAAQGAYDDAGALVLQLHQLLSDEAAHIADVSSLGSNNLQISLAPVLVKLRTTLATTALISSKAQAVAAGITPPLPSNALISSTLDSGI